MDRITNFTQQIAATSSDSDIAHLVAGELGYLLGRYSGNLLRHTISRYRLAINEAVPDYNKRAVVFALLEEHGRISYGQVNTKPRATNER